MPARRGADLGRPALRAARRPEPRRWGCSTSSSAAGRRARRERPCLPIANAWSRRWGSRWPSHSPTSDSGATLREQSSRDPLTGLFNRRYMEESLDREIRRAAREGYGLGILMADLDHFKELNDAFGHAAGDEVLRRIGRFLAAAVRGEDIACRFGGEEFVVILPKASLDRHATPCGGAARRNQGAPHSTNRRACTRPRRCRSAWPRIRSTDLGRGAHPRRRLGDVSRQGAGPRPRRRCGWLGGPSDRGVRRPTCFVVSTIGEASLEWVVPAGERRLRLASVGGSSVVAVSTVPDLTALL